MAAIIAEYLIIFKPLMESFSTGRRARLCRRSAQSRDATEVLEALLQRHIPGSPLDIGRLLVVAVFSRPPATNGGAKSKTLFIPSVMVVSLSHARQPHGLYSAVETGMTFLSLPPFIVAFLPPSLA